jgi:hypothetical protein
MAGSRKNGGAYYCTFRFQGKRYYFTVGDISEAQARAKGTEVDETLNLIERGRLTVPDGVPLEEFVAAGGKAPVVVERSETFTARRLFDRYLTTLGNGTIKEKSLVTLRSHLKQVCKAIFRGLRSPIYRDTLTGVRGRGCRPSRRRRRSPCSGVAGTGPCTGGCSRGRSRPRVAVPEGRGEGTVSHLHRDRNRHRRREPGR